MWTSPLTTVSTVHERCCILLTTGTVVTYLAPMIFGSYPKFGNPLITVAFPHALENPDMFGALVTFAQAHVDTLVRPDGKPSVESLMYWGKTVSLLRDKMSDPERCADDAAILSNIYLMGAASRFQEQEACNTFYLGLQRMVQIRGGLDKLGLDGYVKNCILYIDGLGLASDDASEAGSPPTSESSMPTVQTESPSPPATTVSESPLQYPTHPFPPDLCELVAKLTPGFIDLAMHHYLSIELLRPLERLLYWAAQPGMVLLEHGPGEHLYDLRKVGSRVPGPTKERSKRNTEQLVCLAFMLLSIEVFTGIRGNRLNEARWKLIKTLVVEDFSSKGRLDAEGKLECELKAWFIIMASHAGTEDESALTLDGQKINDTMMDRLLDDEASAPKARSKLEFPYARRWKGPKGLRAVLARFFIDDRLDREWRARWRSHMDRKGIALHPDDQKDVSEPMAKEEEDEDDEATKSRILRYVRERSRLAFVDEQERLHVMEDGRRRTEQHTDYEASRPVGGSQIELSLVD